MLVGLYEEPERPPNAVDYIKRYMGAPAGVDVEALRSECEQLRIDKANLEATIKDLNARCRSSFSCSIDEYDLTLLVYLLFIVK